MRGQLAGKRRLVVAAVAAISLLVNRQIITSGEGLAYRATPTQWVLGLTMLLLTIMAVVTSGFHHRWIFWRQDTREPTWKAITGMLIALVVLVEVFSAATLLMASIGIVELTGWTFIQPTPGRDSGSGGGTWATGSEIYRSMEAYYVWNLLDAVPQLEIPKTLNWKLQHKTTDVSGGVLLLAFKILVILPVVNLLVELVKGARDATDARTKV